MDQLIKLVREICLCILTLLRSLLIISLVALVLVGYLLYLAAGWMAGHPAIWLLPPTAFLTVRFFRRYVLGRDVTVARDSAVIVKRAGGKYMTLYRGWHKLKIGDRVCEEFLLRPESEETNLEEVYTCDEERVRASAIYDRYISDPLCFYLVGRKRPVDYTELNRLVLMAVVEDFGFDDLYNSPFEINELVTQTINNQIRNCGLQVINYQLEELIWPETNERWKRNRSHLALQSRQYWSDSRSLKRQIR